MIYTSKELSKKFAEAGCKLKGEYVWASNVGKKYILINRDKRGEYPNIFNHTYPAYDILNDLCCRYAKYFHNPVINTLNILRALQNGKVNEAEDIILKHWKPFK